MFPFLHKKSPKKSSGLLLPRQGSNLNSSDPESDVLPITPQDNVGAKIIQLYEREITF